MDIPQSVAGRFVRRDNRFRVAVKVGGREVAAHLPNSGRLGELLVPGRLCYLVPRSAPRRRTGYDVLLVAYAGVLISVDARLPNRLFAEAVSAGRLVPFAGVTAAQAEVTHGESRLDFRLTEAAGFRWVETKSVTLVEDGVARFPDAPTARGRRHLEELRGLVAEGHRAAVVFVVQRPDAAVFAPHVQADPAFAEMLARAADAGVGLHAYRCDVSRDAIRIAEEIPVSLP
ncbi:MAG: DNA/RNA nuclease SfsA [Anaerolineae bacterium]